MHESKISILVPFGIVHFLLATFCFRYYANGGEWNRSRTERYAFTECDLGRPREFNAMERDEQSIAPRRDSKYTFRRSVSALSLSLNSRRLTESA